MKKFFDKLYIFLIFIFLYAPIAVLIVFSFNNSKSRVNWEGFTLKWYEQLFSDSVIMNSLSITLAVGCLCAVISTLLGTAAAFGIHHMRKKPRSALMTLNNIPVTNPDIITGVSLMLLFVFAGTLLWGDKFELGFGTLLIAHVTFSTPYVILSVIPKLRQLDKNLYEAALDLGAKPFYAFRRVIFPQIAPGVITGAIMAFTLSIDDFAVSYFTTGNTAQTLAITIYSMTKRRVSPKINALSSIMFLSVLILLIIVNVRQMREERKEAAR